jgi:hypothetical protein
MSDRRRGEGKELKTVRREVLDEIGSEINQHRTEPTYRNPNRDQARGDWDRSGRHTDEERSRDQGKDGGSKSQVLMSGGTWKLESVAYDDELIVGRLDAGL